MSEKVIQKEKSVLPSSGYNWRFILFERLNCNQSQVTPYMLLHSSYAEALEMRSLNSRVNIGQKKTKDRSKINFQIHVMYITML